MEKAIFTFTITLSAIVCIAQDVKELAAGYYTVVGAYDNSREDYARRYADELKGKGYDAQYGLNPNRNLFFVYIHSHGDLKSALQGMYKMREKPEFKDAWVRVVPGVIGERAEAPRPEPIKEEAKTEVVATETVAQQPVTQPAVPLEETTEPPEEPIQQVYPQTLGNSEVFLSLYNAANNRIVDGDVSVIDTDRGRLIKTVKGNEYLNLPDPRNESGKITLICDAFGYRKLQLDINYRNPEKDTALAHVDMMGLSFVVLFDLVRYRTGEVQTLSHVYFYNDAALMIPESRYEVDQLMEMMKENPRMKICLHGHTNGNYHGKIIKMGPEKNFFSIGKDAVNTVGTAKDLSYERAEIIREYLMSGGVSGERIEVKGWGGKKPLFDKHSANARKNVRVEVEVLAD